MKNWRLVHGYDFKVPAYLEASLVTHGFQDESHGNDACPVFRLNCNPGAPASQPVLNVHCGHPDPAQREAGGKQFTVSLTYNYSDLYAENLYEGDSWLDLLQAVAIAMNNYRQTFYLLFSMVTGDAHHTGQTSWFTIPGAIVANERAIAGDVPLRWIPANPPQGGK